MFNARYKPTIITAQPDISDLRQEFNDNGHHRIVHSDGTATPFVPVHPRWRGEQSIQKAALGM